MNRDPSGMVSRRFEFGLSGLGLGGTRRGQPPLKMTESEVRPNSGSSSRTVSVGIRGAQLVNGERGS